MSSTPGSTADVEGDVENHVEDGAVVIVEVIVECGLSAVTAGGGKLSPCCIGRGRMSAGGKAGGKIAGRERPKGNAPVHNPIGKGPSANKLAGAFVGVGERSVAAAGKVRRDGIPELAAAVDAGAASVAVTRSRRLRCRPGHTPRSRPAEFRSNRKAVASQP